VTTDGDVVSSAVPFDVTKQKWKLKTLAVAFTRISPFRVLRHVS